MRYNYRIILLAFFLTLFCGCGPGYEFNRAKQLETDGYFVQAAIKYEDIFKKYPAEPMAAESLYRAGCIYQKQLQLFPKADMLFTKVLQYYAGVQPWVRLAETALFDTPDYFPLGDGNFWIEGDSRTGGENMRAEWACTEVSSTSFRINKRIGAGRSLVAEVNKYYTKQNLELRESSDKNFKESAVLLSYPFEPGRTWTTARDGRKIKCKVVEKNALVKVVAGEFSNCLKISEEYPSLQGAIKYNYYAPGVGWILTTTSSIGGQEFRSSELLTYRIKPVDSKAKNLAAAPETKQKTGKQKHKTGKK
jgi:hypothetical protein